MSAWHPLSHGWRNTFKTIGREASIEDSALDAVCGHAPSSVGEGYGSVSIAAQRRAFERFPRYASSACAETPALAKSCMTRSPGIPAAVSAEATAAGSA